MRRSLLAFATVPLRAVSTADAQHEFAATLAGHVIIPAVTFIDAPADAPRDIQTSGTFAGGPKCIHGIGTVEGDGTLWVITDNGFGSKANSSDSAPDPYAIVTSNPGQPGSSEGPLWDAEKKDWEKLDGRTVLRFLEFSLAEQNWTGRHWKYVLEANATSIGDFNMIAIKQNEAQQLSIHSAHLVALSSKQTAIPAS